MSHFLLKFNYGVEIGAYLAYKGHYQVTGDRHIRRIAREELIHRGNLRRLLATFGEKPSPTINRVFKAIGSTIQKLCFYAPRPILNLVAQSMEMFAIVSYNYLAKKYPEQEMMFGFMALAEEEHRNYFRGV